MSLWRKVAKKVVTKDIAKASDKACTSSDLMILFGMLLFGSIPGGIV